MSELRWTLLILGVVFIGALSWWERRRPRQAFAPRLREASPAPHSEPSHGPDAQPREPWIGDAGLSDVVSSDVTLPHSDGVHAPSAPGPLEDLPTLVIPDEEECKALEAAWDEQQPEPTLIDPEAGTKPAAEQPREELAPPTPTEAAPPLEPEIRGAEGVGAVRIVEYPYGNGAASPEPVVDWPPEESRRILAVRIVAPQPDRFPGRSLRLALAAEGFLLGKFAIFHKPDETNRAVLSAASLNRPGAFDLATMDTQRYGGLSLFAVLPGTKAPPQAFEELLATARNLNERLEGALQDERGGPLTPLRVASIRDSLKTEAAAHNHAAAHEG